MLLFDGASLLQTQSLPASDLWYFLPFGYLLTVAVETPILLVGLSGRLSLGQKLFCGFWLTACTYPIVVLLLATAFLGESRWMYLLVAETFAPLAECVIFWLAFRGRDIEWIRSFVAIVFANLASFGVGEIMNYFRWFGLF